MEAALMSVKGKGSWVAAAVFAALGVMFAAVSTSDFVSYLDRQLHAITCSYVPGLGAADATGTSGCHVALMSPYSSVFRADTWGGVPISLAALGVFAFLLFRAVDLLRRRDVGRGEARFMVAATALPVVVSVIYLGVSVVVLHAVCKLCVGIYVSSLGTFVAAIVGLWRAPAARTPGTGGGPSFVFSFLEGVVFVAVPLALYLVLKPAYPIASGTCGELLHPEDRYGVRLHLTNPPGGAPAIELLDPLCPACRAMNQRLAAGGFNDRLSREAVLFPLDKECNWMLHESVHPGACAVSEAVLCAGAQVDEVLAWSFAHQDELRELGRRDPAQLTARITAQFPQVAGCIGRPEVRARLNRSLRWAVANSLPVVTPQLFVRGEKICDEDTDLGLEFVLHRILSGAGPPPRSGSRRGGR
jgi:uncharacterized membrane protein